MSSFKGRVFVSGYYKCFTAHDTCPKYYFVSFGALQFRFVKWTFFLTFNKHERFSLLSIVRAGRGRRRGVVLPLTHGPRWRLPSRTGMRSGPLAAMVAVLLLMRRVVLATADAAAGTGAFCGQRAVGKCGVKTSPVVLQESRAPGKVHVGFLQYQSSGHAFKTAFH